jgi:CRISPR-associated protein Cas8a1/Csx13
MPLSTQVVNHQCLTNSSFLQNNKFFKSGGVVSESLTVDEIPIEVKYKRAVSYAHQNFASKICDLEGNLYQEPIQIVSWLYPGAIVRHAAADKSTKIEETVEQAIALLYAPVACIYYLVKSKIHQKKAQYAVVIPLITNLESYALQRLELNHLSYQELYVTGTGDAGLKSLYYLATSQTTDPNKIQNCKVIVYGSFNWSKQQKVRGDVKLIKSTVAVNHHYQLIHHLFPNRVVRPPKKKALLL